MSCSDTLSWGNEFYNEVVNYQIQIDDDVAFGSPEIDEAVNPGLGCSMALNAFADYDNLANLTTYYWRLRPVYSNGMNTVFTWVDVPSFMHQVPVMVKFFVALQGANRPNPAGWQIPLSVCFYNPGSDVMTATPVHSFTATAVAEWINGGTKSVISVGPLNPGIYDITIDSTTTLLNVKRSVGIW